MDRRRLIGIALAAASACGYGSGALFAKGVYGAGLDWLALLAWRFLIASALLWAWVLFSPSNRAALRVLPRRHGLALFGLGLYFISNAGTYYAGIQWIDASLAALIVYIYPAIVAVLSIRLGHGLHGTRPWAALGIVTVGVVLSIGGIQTRAEPLGLALMIASPCLYSGYIIMAARVAGERRGETASQRTGGDGAGAEVPPAVAAAIMTTGTFAITATLALLTGERALPGEIPGDAWFGLVGIGVFSTALAISAFYASTARIGAASAALVSTVEPIWTIVLANRIFDERLSAVQLAGGALVLGGVLLAQTAPGPRPEAIVGEP